MHCLQLLSIPALPQPINLAAAPRQLLENHKNHLVGTSTLEPKCWKTWSHFPWINFKTERTKTEYAGLCCQQRWRQRASTHPKAKDPQMLPVKWWWWVGWEKEKLTEEIGTSYLLFKASIDATVWWLMHLIFHQKVLLNQVEPFTNKSHL